LALFVALSASLVNPYLAAPEAAAPEPVRAPRPLQAALILSVLYLLSRLTGLVQTSIINALLPGAATNAYWGAFALPNLVFYLVAGGAISVTFIPLFVQLSQHDEEEAWHFFSALATLMTVALMLLVAAGCYWARPLVLLLKPGFAQTPVTLDLAVSMTRIMLPAQMCFYLGGLIVGVLNSHKRFAASGWTGAVYNLVAILVALLIYFTVGARNAPLGSPAFTTGALGFSWGILLGALAGNFLLPLLAARGGPPERRLRFRPNFDWGQPAIRRYFIAALPIMLGVSLPVVDQNVIEYFASLLPGDALTHLSTGNRFMLAPLGIVAQAASVAAFPYLAADSGARDWHKFAEFLRTGLKRLLFLTLPLSTLLILNAKPIIDLLSGYGRYDDPFKLNQTSIAFAFFCVGLFAWAGQALVARGFYALHDTYTPTIIGSILTVFFIALAWLVTKLGDAQWGVLGLSLATSIGATAHFVGVLFALEKKLAGHQYQAPLGIVRVTGTLLRTFVACLPMGFVGLLALALTTRVGADLGKLGDIIQILVVSTLSLLVFVAAARAASIPEWQWLQGKLLGRFKRSTPA
jgi:putative peptidoglycan lipid II flippase